MSANNIKLESTKIKTNLDIAEIMRLCHGLIDLSTLQKVSDDENSYIYTAKDTLLGLFGQEVYYRDYVYFELIPENAGLGDNFRANQLEYVEKEYLVFEKLKKANKWETIFSMIDKRIGLTKFVEAYQTEIPEKYVYDAFIAVYQKSEFGFEILKDHYHNILKTAKWSKKRKHRLKKLKQKLNGDRNLVIYHGDSSSHPVYDYYSWTLKLKTAHFFASRYYGKGEIWSREIKYKDAIDYLTSRNEEEVIYDYEPEKEDGNTTKFSVPGGVKRG